jgi:hypothetical protein
VAALVGGDDAVLAAVMLDEIHPRLRPPPPAVQAQDDLSPGLGVKVEKVGSVEGGSVPLNFYMTHGKTLRSGVFIAFERGRLD